VRSPQIRILTVSNLPTLPSEGYRFFGAAHPQTNERKVLRTQSFFCRSSPIRSTLLVFNLSESPHPSPHIVTLLIPLPPAAGHRRVAFPPPTSGGCPCHTALPIHRPPKPNDLPAPGQTTAPCPNTTGDVSHQRACTLFKMTPLPFSPSEPYCIRAGIVRTTLLTRDEADPADGRRGSVSRTR